MSNIYLYVLLALAAGAVLPTQAAVNNKLAEFAGGPVAAAFISFAVGTLVLFVYMLISGVHLAEMTSAKNAPVIAWIGGILGAFFVTSTIMLLPRLGVAMTFSIVIAGQMVLTLIIDHFGLLGVPEKPVSLPRIAGALLVTAGVILIRRF